MKWKLVLPILLFAVFLAGTGTIALAGGPPPDQVELEPSYYNGDVYLLAIPSARSANPNQAVFACFNLGPDMTDQQTGPYGTLYVILVPGATQVACPDGSLRHDHVLSTVPGTAGYVPRWQIILAVPGPAFDPAIMPVTSVSAVEAAVEAGQLELVDTGIVFNAPVLGQAGR
ncbi:MAG TPA: hypothetical protein VGA03_07330 [Anaerolineales bacterium]